VRGRSGVANRRIAEGCCVNRYPDTRQETHRTRFVGAEAAPEWLERGAGPINARW
jgi:hypothetical protein